MEQTQDGVHFFAGIAGWWEDGVIHDAVHNRTVNLKGGRGHNLAMDRVCEFLNAEFKGMLRSESESEINTVFVILLTKSLNQLTVSCNRAH